MTRKSKKICNKGGKIMKTFNIWKTNGRGDILCRQVEAKTQRSALRKYQKIICKMSTGEYWIDKDCLRSSYGGEWKAVEVM